MSTLVMLVVSGCSPDPDRRALPEVTEQSPLAVQVAATSPTPSGRASAGSDPLVHTQVTSTLPEMKALRQTLAAAVTDATRPGHTANLLAMLDRSDHDRIGRSGAVDWSDVDRAADGFRAAWRARFGTSFDVSDQIAVLFDAPSVEVVPDAGPSPMTMPGGTAATNGLTLVLTDFGRPGTVTLRMTNEGGGVPDWRFDLGGTASAAQVHDGLLRQLTAVAAAQASWPTDVGQAYLYVDRHVLAPFGTVGARPSRP